MAEPSLWRPLRPQQLFLWLQLPFATGVVLLGAGVAATAPVRHELLLFGGMALAAVATLLFLVRRDRWVSSAWIVLIPALDVLALAAARTALLPYLPTFGFLCLFPFTWLVYRFRWTGLAMVLAGSIVITATPFLAGAAPVSTGLAFISLIALPVIACSISFGVLVVARNFERGQEAVNRSRLETAAALARSRDGELLLRSLLDTVSGAVAFFDAEGRPTIANAAAEQWGRRAGLHEPDVGCSRVLAADKATPVPFEQRVVPRALRGETVENELEWIGEPGDMIALMATSRRILRSDGALLGTVVAAYDVTELAEAVEVREQFLATVSHELRTPLTSIMGYTEYVTDELGERAEELGIDRALATITRNTEKLLDRVAQLLSAADKSFEPRLLPTDLAPLLQASCDSLRVIAADVGVALTSDLPAPLIAEVDGPHLAQAVENLLTNAVKFTPRGGTVHLAASVDGDEAVVSVTDTGVGMSAEEQRRAFDRFYRSRGARDTTVQGIGVGLAIVKQIMDAHDGRIELRSEPGQGSVFTLHLPLRRL